MRGPESHCEWFPRKLSDPTQASRSTLNRIRGPNCMQNTLSVSLRSTLPKKSNEGRLHANLQSALCFYFHFIFSIEFRKIAKKKIFLDRFFVANLQRCIMLCVAHSSSRDFFCAVNRSRCF